MTGARVGFRAFSVLPRDSEMMPQGTPGNRIFRNPKIAADPSSEPGGFAL